MKAALLLFGLGALAVLAGAHPDHVRIGTLNVRNYLQQNRWHEGAYRFDHPKPEEEKARLRALLLEVRPDILLLQEMGSPKHLDELREDLATGGLVYPHRHYAGDPESRIGLALLSVIPPMEVLFIPPGDAGGRPETLLRGLQEAAFRVGQARLRIFHVHLKSRYTTNEEDPDSRNFRRAEFRNLAGLVEARLGLSRGKEALLLAGDFNTPFDSPLLEPLRKGWEPMRPADAHGEAWTYHHHRSGTRETIDGFWRVRAGDPPFSPGGVFPPGREASAGSDHRLVVIEWRPVPPDGEEADSES